MRTKGAIFRRLNRKNLEAADLGQLCELLGLPESESQRVQMRLELAKAIRNVIAKGKLTQVQAGEKAKVGRTVVTAIVNGNLDRISTDRLLDVAQGLGLRFRIKVA